MANKWVDHVKQFAKVHNLNYAQALGHPDIKKNYDRKTKIHKTK